MRMFASPRRGFCASCEGEIIGRPVYRMDEAYCCVGCSAGGPCVCNYEADLADDGVDRLGLLAPVEPRVEVTADVVMERSSDRATFAESRR
jgi:hypothetical protein